MSTRDEDNEDRSLPSNGTGYRFPIRDRRFEQPAMEDDDEDDADDPDVDEGVVPSDPAVAASADPIADFDLGSVRVRTRGPSVPHAAPAVEAPVSDAAPAVASDTGPGVDPDDTPPEEPGIQIIDTPRPSRIAEAARRARNVQLSDRESRLIDQTRLGEGADLIGMVSNSPRIQRAAPDTRSTDDFDAQFIADARAAFGDGFIPANALPGDIGDRVRHIVSVSTIYAEEFILDQLERMVLSKVPADTIAARFRVSIPTISKWRKKLRARWAAKVQELKSDNISSVIGEHMAKFEVRMAMGMALAQKPNATLQEITRGLEIAERAQTNLIKYQDMLGLHEQKPLAISADSTHQEDQHVKNAKGLTNAISELFGLATAFPVAGGDDGADLEEEDYYSRVAE